jgi:hypothetical protein
VDAIPVSRRSEVGIGVPSGAAFYGWGQVPEEATPEIQAVMDVCRDRGISFVPMVQHNLFGETTVENALNITSSLVTYMDGLVASASDVMDVGWGFSEFGIHHTNLRNCDGRERIIGGTLESDGSLRFLMVLCACGCTEVPWIDPHGEALCDPWNYCPLPAASLGFGIGFYDSGFISVDDLVQCLRRSQELYRREHTPVISFRTYGFQMADGEPLEIERALALYDAWRQLTGQPVETGVHSILWSN